MNKPEDVNASCGSHCSTAVRLPAEGEYVRMYGTLIRSEDVTPKEVVIDYIFEETTARLEARINGKTVKKYGTFNNFYGKDTCVQSAIEEARQQQKWLGESNLEFVVVKITSQTRMRPSRHQREEFYAKGIRKMETLPHGCRWNLPDDVEEDVWSSLSQ